MTRNFFIKPFRKESIQESINYWIIRLLPLSDDLVCGNLNPKPRQCKKSTSVLVSNRTGKEEDTVYSGCSCHFKFNPFTIGKTLNKREQSGLYCVLDI